MSGRLKAVERQQVHIDSDIVKMLRLVVKKGESVPDAISRMLRPPVEAAFAEAIGTMRAARTQSMAGMESAGATQGG